MVRQHFSDQQGDEQAECRDAQPGHILHHRTDGREQQAYGGGEQEYNGKKINNAMERTRPAPLEEKGEYEGKDDAAEKGE